MLKLVLTTAVACVALATSATLALAVNVKIGASEQPAPLPANNPDLSQQYLGPSLKLLKANDCNAATRQRQLCIAYWTVGPLASSPPAGQPPLLMINGSASTAAEWDPHMLARLAANRQLILPDNRCVGSSGCRLDAQGDPVLKIKYMANDMNSFLLALPASLVNGPIDVLGWSMGGEVAQSLATNYPARVRRLVLAGTLPGSGLLANKPCTAPYNPNPDTDAVFGCGPTTLGPDWANNIDDSATCKGSNNRGQCQDLQLRTLFEPCYADPTNPDENVCTWNSGPPAPSPVVGEHACTQAISAYAQWPGKQAACASLQRTRVASGEYPNGQNNQNANAQLPDDFSLDPQGYGTADAQDNAENNWLYGTPAPDPPPTNPNWGLLPQLAMPVFIAAGNGDVLTPGANSQAIYKQILTGNPTVQPSLVTYNTAGHAFLFQCNEDLAGRVDGFLVAATPTPVNTTTDCVSDLAPSPNFSTPQLAPAGWNFGDTVVGSLSSSQTFTLSNPGSTPFGVGGVSIAPAPGQQGSEEFTVEQSAPGSCQTNMTLQPGGSCTYSVAYAPTAPGAAAGILTVDSDAGPQTAGLEGTGTQSTVSLTPGERSFGPVATGGSASYVFNLDNNGSSAVTVTSFSVTGEGASQFSLAPAKPIGCKQGAVLSGSTNTCGLAVTYNPQTAGLVAAQLEVQTTAGAVLAQLDGTASLSAPSPLPAAAAEPQQTVVTTSSTSHLVDASGTVAVGLACVAASDSNCSGSAHLLAPSLSLPTVTAARAGIAARKRSRARQDRRVGARLVGQGAVSIRERKSDKVTIKLNRTGRKFLRSRGRVSMILSHVADDGSPSIANRITLRFRGSRRAR